MTHSDGQHPADNAGPDQPTPDWTGSSPGGGWQPGQQSAPPRSPYGAPPPPYDQQPQYGNQQPQYWAPQNQQPQHGAPEYGAPQYGNQPPQVGNPQYAAPQYGNQQAPYGTPRGLAPAPGGDGAGPRRGRRRAPMILTALGVVVILLAAAGVWFFAIRDAKSAGGQDTPQLAVSTLLDSVQSKDVVGLADQLDPAESALLLDLRGDAYTQLQRLGVIDRSVAPDGIDLNGTTGIGVSMSGLTYDPTPEQVNDHVAIVKLTGGTVTITADPSKIPFTDSFKELVNAQGQQPETRTYDIGKRVADRDAPVRIATVERAGKWYPSILYTLADRAVQQADLGNPTAADAIPAVGSASPEAAMNALADATVAGDASTLIGLLDPTEMSAAHDYGSLLLKAADYSGAEPMDGVTLSDRTWTVSDTTGGKLVSLGSLTVTTSQGDSTTVKRDGDALEVTENGKTTTYTADDFADLARQFSSGSGDSDARTQAILRQEFTQNLGLGVVMTENDGQWYVSPLRTYSNTMVSLLKGLQPGDLEYLLNGG